MRQLPQLRSFLILMMLHNVFCSNMTHIILNFESKIENPKLKKKEKKLY